MAYITEITADGELNTALQTFKTVCTANQIALGLDVPELAEITGASTNFSTGLNTWTVDKQAATNSRVSKDTIKVASRATIAKWAKIFRANDAISDELLAELMLPAHSTPGSSTPPNQPLDLVGSADGLGNIRLSWKRNGNRPTTVFLIEYRTSAAGAWAVLNSTTKTKFETQATVGSYIEFRVLAQRAGSTSIASWSVTLWGGTEEIELEIAA